MNLFVILLVLTLASFAHGQVHGVPVPAAPAPGGRRKAAGISPPRGPHAAAPAPGGRRKAAGIAPPRGPHAAAPAPGGRRKAQVNPGFSICTPLCTGGNTCIDNKCGTAAWPGATVSVTHGRRKAAENSADDYGAPTPADRRKL